MRCQDETLWNHNCNLAKQSHHVRQTAATKVKIVFEHWLTDKQEASRGEGGRIFKFMSNESAERRRLLCEQGRKITAGQEEKTSKSSDEERKKRQLRKDEVIVRKKK